MPGRMAGCRHGTTDDLPPFELAYPGPLRDTPVAAWREAHERFWYASVPDLMIDESTVLVAERFRVVETFDDGST